MNFGILNGLKRTLHARFLAYEVKQKAFLQATAILVLYTHDGTYCSGVSSGEAAGSLGENVYRCKLYFLKFKKKFTKSGQKMNLYFIRGHPNSKQADERCFISTTRYPLEWLKRKGQDRHWASVWMRNTCSRSWLKHTGKLAVPMKSKHMVPYDLAIPLLEHTEQRHVLNSPRMHVQDCSR